MASRGGPGVGVYVTITILAVLSLTLFILTFVFLSKYQAEHQNLQAAQNDLKDFVTRDERLGDAAQTVVQAAKIFQDGGVQAEGGTEGPAMNALMLGIPGERFVRFRETAKRAESGAASSADALFALFFLVDAALRRQKA